MTVDSFRSSIVSSRQWRIHVAVVRSIIVIGQLNGYIRCRYLKFTELFMLKKENGARKQNAQERMPETMDNRATITPLEIIAFSQVLSNLPHKNIARLSCCLCVRSILSAPWAFSSSWDIFDFPQQCPGIYVERMHPKHLEYHAIQGTRCKCLCTGVLINGGLQVFSINPFSKAVRVLISAAKSMEMLRIYENGCRKEARTSLVMHPEASEFNYVRHLQASYSQIRLYGRAEVRLPPGDYSVSWRIGCKKPVNEETELVSVGKFGYLGAAAGLRQAWPLKSSIRCSTRCKVSQFLVHPSKMAAFPDWTEVEVALFRLRGKSNELNLVEMSFALMTCDCRWKSSIYIDSLVIQQIQI